MQISFVLSLRKMDYKDKPCNDGVLMSALAFLSGQVPMHGTEERYLS
jgi:hypothetical protein